MPDLQVPVLIVGGSLVGMSTAVLLGHHGIRAMAVEHHQGTAIHPRAAQISQRTMEIFRTVGLEQIVRRRSGEQFVQDGAIMAVESLAGREIGYFIANLNEGVQDISPTERVFISQSLLEPLLKARAEELGAELRFGTDLIAFEQRADGVNAVISQRDAGGRTERVRASYLVAADGAHSAIREKLGIPLRGRGVFSRSVTIYFRADVAPLLRGRNLSVIYVNNPVLRGFFRFEKPFDRGFLAVNALGDPQSPVTDVAIGLTEERCTEWVRVALGADVPIAIENVMGWNAAADSAERYQNGRVFLAGDAAHVMPPNGGFGGNTGVQDAHNLAWKLAMVLRGEARPELLSTYDAERRPVGAFTTEQAYSRYVTRTAPYLGTEGMQPVAPDLNVELGYQYDSAAICHEGDAGPRHESPRESKGRPGSRAPHVWLRRHGERISTLDLFGGSFVVLAGPEALSWHDSARAVARQLASQVEVHRIGADGLEDPDAAFVDAYGLTARDAVLVRPDGFVSWRSKTPAGSPSAIAAALAQSTCRDTIVS